MTLRNMREQGGTSPASSRHNGQLRASHACAENSVRSNALLRAKDRCETCGSRQHLELHHVGHRGDASLFNCLVLCARCHRAEDTRRRNARPGWEK
jgi:hypothetical protein